MSAQYAPLDSCDVLIVGGGSAGIATAASLLRRRPGLDVRIVEPSEHHYYQPGWTMVGAGVFTPERTRRRTEDLIPQGAQWVRGAVAAFDPVHDRVELTDGRWIGYRMLVAAPGLKLDWGAIPGLAETLGRNNVTSNYGYETAPYTWKLVQAMHSGRAIFTQPPMPIKCAGAPQKAMYLSADHWRDHGRNDIEIEFHNAGPVLFGVKDYVPALMEYVRKYRIDLNFGSKLVAVDGPARTATFAVTSASTPATSRGGFVLENLPPGTYTVTFARKGTRSTSSIVTLAAGQHVELTPNLVSPASISGQVRLAADPAAGVELRLYTAEQYGTAATPVMVTRSGTDGRYAFQDVDAPAHYVIEVRSATGATALTTSPAITIAQSDSATYDFTLESLS